MALRFFLVAILGIALPGSGCNKSEEDNPHNNPGSSNGSLSCEINSQPYSFKDISASVIIANFETLSVSASIDRQDGLIPTSLVFEVLLKPQLQQGTYQFGSSMLADTVVVMTFFEAKNNTTAATWLSEDNMGSITISEFDRNNLTVSGTFSGTLLLGAHEGGNPPEEVNITNGVFTDVKFLYDD